MSDKKISIKKERDKTEKQEKYKNCEIELKVKSDH